MVKMSSRTNALDLVTHLMMFLCVSVTDMCADTCSYKFIVTWRGRKTEMLRQISHGVTTEKRQRTAATGSLSVLQPAPV